jgi:RNA polymerase sigma-70 factor (ECF subfamily)
LRVVKTDTTLAERDDTTTPLAERDDDALMLLAGRGLTEAFAVLVRRHQRALRSFCARASGDVRAGDDLAQEVFVVVWRQRVEYQALGHFRSYLLTIAAGRCKNERRARQRRAEEPAPRELSAQQRTPSSAQLDSLVASERQRKLYELVAKLPAAQAQALRLRYAAELDYAEIAAIAKRSEATIRSRVFLALKQLKKRIAKGSP